MHLENDSQVLLQKQNQIYWWSPWQRSVAKWYIQRESVIGMIRILRIKSVNLSKNFWLLALIWPYFIKEQNTNFVNICTTYITNKFFSIIVDKHSNELAKSIKCKRHAPTQLSSLAKILYMRYSTVTFRIQS